MDSPEYIVSRLDLAENLFYLDGKPFSLKDYPTHEVFYEGDFLSAVFKCGRKVAKTETAVNTILTDTIARLDFKTLYILPSKAQTSAFSHSRLNKAIMMSPEIQKLFVNNKLAQNVFLKMFTNGSEIHLNYADNNPDRVRGVIADRIIYDEVQDIEYSSVVPIINKALQTSNYGYELYLGTPKTLDNALEYLWSISSQTEWVVKCHHCNKHNIYLNRECVGETGIYCLHCWGYVNVRNGEWYDTVSNYKKKGFHIPQVIIPANIEDPRRFNQIKEDLDNPKIPESTVENEIFGISSKLGSRLLTKTKMESLCGDYTVNHDGLPKGIVLTFAGIDWSGGGTDCISRTCLWVYGVTDRLNDLRTVYFKIFFEDNLLKDIDEISTILKKFKTKIIVTDAENKLANNLLVVKMGIEKIFPLQWGAYKHIFEWNKVDRYEGNKTMLVDDYMGFLLSAKNKIFHNKEQMKYATEDFLSLYEHTTQNGSGRRIWVKYPAASDDAFCASTYARLGWRIAMGELTAN